MTDLPKSPFDLTPDQARQIEAGAECDRLYMKARGWRVEEIDDVRDPYPFKAISPNGKTIKAAGAYGTMKVPKQLQVSRTAEAAHRAEQWIQSRIDDEAAVGAAQTGMGTAYAWYSPKATVDCELGMTLPGEERSTGLAFFDPTTVYADNTKLARARLLLLLVAEGVIEPEDDQ